jgi:hypothetical protein
MVPHLMPPPADSSPQASHLASGLLAVPLHTIALDMSLALRWLALSALACLLLSKPLSLAEVARRAGNHPPAGH